MSGVLRPGAHRATGVSDDAAVIAALLRVEVAWAHALVAAGVSSEHDAAAVAQAAGVLDVDHAALAAAAEAAGNVVVPLVRELRAAAGAAAPAVHRGLTSQDALDTAFVLLARDAAARLAGDLQRTGVQLAAVARKHRSDVMAGRTLTQWAVPTTFGLKAAQWLTGIADALDRLDSLAFPVQYGGAAGTRALLSSLAPRVDQSSITAAFAHQLGLASTDLPWHTRRTVITAIGDALVTSVDALGVIAADICLLGRPEVDEVREGAAPGRGGSSTMPHKQNPVLSVLIASAAKQAPLLAAQLHLAAGDAVDERPDGAWHSEWPALAGLLELAVIAGAQAAELTAELEVDAVAMARRADAAAGALLAERGEGQVDVRDYLGEAEHFVDIAVDRWEARRG